MILDSKLEFSDGQEVAASTASTEEVDLQAGGDAGNELYLAVQVDSASDSADDGETVTAVLQTADSADFSDAVEHSTKVSVAQLPAGTQALVQRIPQGTKRYNRMYYAVGGSALTQNPKVSAFLTNSPQTNK